MNLRNGVRLGLSAAVAVAIAFGAGLLASSQVSAQDEAVSMGRVTLGPGAQATLDLDALDIAAPGLGAWEIGIHYDPSIVTPVACSPEANSLCNPGFAQNKIQVVGATATGLQGDTTLASVTFRCESVGATALTLVVKVLADATAASPQRIDAAVEHGSIACTPPAPPPPPGLEDLGDVNCDGIVNSRDAALILQYHARLTNTLPCLWNADVNLDALIDSRDAALVLQFDAGLIMGLG